MKNNFKKEWLLKIGLFTMLAVFIVGFSKEISFVQATSNCNHTFLPAEVPGERDNMFNEPFHVLRCTKCRYEIKKHSGDFSFEYATPSYDVIKCGSCGLTKRKEHMFMDDECTVCGYREEMRGKLILSHSDVSIKVGETLELFVFVYPSEAEGQIWLGGEVEEGDETIFREADGDRGIEITGLKPGKINFEVSTKNTDTGKDVTATCLVTIVDSSAATCKHSYAKRVDSVGNHVSYCTKCGTVGRYHRILLNPGYGDKTAEGHYRTCKSCNEPILYPHKMQGNTCIECGYTGKVVASGLEISPTEKTLSVGDTFIIKPVSLSSDLEGTLFYSLDKFDYIRLNSDGTNGYVTAVAPGTTIVTVKTENGYTATCTVTVVKENTSTGKDDKDDEDPEEEVIEWGNASSWAKKELRKAQEYDLIPDIFEDEDLTDTITRKEFAAVAVKMYEAITGKTAKVSKYNPFTDTKNEDVLKAYRLGITNGTSDTTFSPNKSITREQMATMLCRGIERAGIDIDVYKGKKLFADDNDFSEYARNSIYFMADNDLINGVGDNLFSPKGTATREQALLISVRSYLEFEDE